MKKCNKTKLGLAQRKANKSLGRSLPVSDLDDLGSLVDVLDEDGAFAGVVGADLAGLFLLVGGPLALDAAAGGRGGGSFRRTLLRETETAFLALEQLLVDGDLHVERDLQNNESPLIKYSFNEVW